MVKQLRLRQMLYKNSECVVLTSFNYFQDYSYLRLLVNQQSKMTYKLSELDGIFSSLAIEMSNMCSTVEPSRTTHQGWHWHLCRGVYLSIV